MIDIVGLVFSAVGVILAVYSVGQLVLAFKNEDADSKSRASTMLVVAIVLVAFPSIVKGLNLVDNRINIPITEDLRRIPAWVFSFTEGRIC